MKSDLLNCFTQLLIISKTKQETDREKRLRASSLTVQSTRISFLFLQRLNSRRLIIDENVDHKNDVISRLTILYHDLKYLRSIDGRKKIHSGLFEETTFYFRVWKPGFCNNQIWLLQDHRRSLYCKLSETVRKKYEASKRRFNRPKSDGTVKSENRLLKNSTTHQ